MLLDELILYNPNRSFEAQVGILLFLYLEHAKIGGNTRLFPFEFYVDKKGQVQLDHIIYDPLLDEFGALDRYVYPFLEATRKNSDKAILETVKKQFHPKPNTKLKDPTLP